VVGKRTHSYNERKGKNDGGNLIVFSFFYFCLKQPLVANGSNILVFGGLSYFKKKYICPTIIENELKIIP
jgi:hypothetical protein